MLSTLYSAHEIDEIGSNRKTTMSKYVKLCQCLIDKIRHCRNGIQTLDKIRHFLDIVELHSDNLGFSIRHSVMRRGHLSKLGISSLTHNKRMYTQCSWFASKWLDAGDTAVQKMSNSPFPAVLTRVYDTLSQLPER